MRGLSFAAAAAGWNVIRRARSLAAFFGLFAADDKSEQHHRGRCRDGRIRQQGTVGGWAGSRQVRRRKVRGQVLQRRLAAAGLMLLQQSAWLEANADSSVVTNLHELPHAPKYFFPQIARLLRPCRLYFEIGNRDGYSDVTFGRDEAFANFRPRTAKSTR
jgi:hypothetical protein